MGKKRFLAILSAIAISMSFTAPVTVTATEAEESADTIDDEQEEGEQTTVAAPDADSESSSGGGAGSSTGHASTGSSGGSSAGSTKSSDSSLAHLGISPGSLSPAFSAGTHEYTASVDAGVTAISVAARPSDSNAVIASVTGAKTLKPGTNTVKVVVEAQNGATTTYTITVNCGSATTATEKPALSEEPAADTTPEDDAVAPEGEISTIEDTPEEEKEKSEITFDDNGYLIYEGNAYIPSSMMPEGEYVSLDKYNKLYEQSQTQKSNHMRVLIILIVILVLLLIVILNLALKLRDVRMDVRLGLDGLDDDDEAGNVQVDTSMIPDVRMPETVKASRPEKQPKPEKRPEMEKQPKPEKRPETGKQPKPEKQSGPEKQPRPEKQPKPEKQSRSAKKGKTADPSEDLEILDLNDL